MIETSKSFAKEFMRKNNIPTPDFKVIHSAAEALDYLPSAQFPLVIKADGLAAGKGVYICQKKGGGRRRRSRRSCWRGNSANRENGW